MGSFAVPPPIRGGFEITPPQIDPYANLRALAMQGQIAQQRQGIATAQQEMQARGQQMQLVDQQIKDQQAIAQSLRERPDGESTEDFVKRAVDNGASGNAALGLVQHFADLRAKNAQATESELKATQQRHEMLASQVQTILDAKTPEEKASRWAQYHPQMLRELDPGESIPGDLPDDDTLQSLRSGHMLTGDVAKQNLEKAQTGAATATAAEATAKAEHQKIINKLIDTGNQAAQNGRNPIDDIFPESLDKQTHDGYAAAWVAAGRQPPDENGRRPAQDQIVAAAASHAAEYQRATSPTIRAGEVQKAVDIKTQTAPIERENLIATQRALNNVPGYENIPPKEIPKVQGEVAKVVDAYGNALNASNEMAEVIDLMRHGNVSAYAYAPVTGVLTVNTSQGVKRVNMAEIKTYGGAGSLAARVEGFLGKQVSGKSIPDEVVNAMEGMNNSLAQNARNTAAIKINGLKRVYPGLNVNPDDVLVKNERPPAAAPAKAAPAVGTVSRGYRFKGGDPSKQENWEKQ